MNPRNAPPLTSAPQAREKEAHREDSVPRSAVFEEYCFAQRARYRFSEAGTICFSPPFLSCT